MLSLLLVSSDSMKSLSASRIPSNIACLGSDGKQSYEMIYRWRLSLRKSEHSEPLCPSRTQKKLHRGHLGSITYSSDSSGAECV